MWAKKLWSTPPWQKAFTTLEKQFILWVAQWDQWLRPCCKSCLNLNVDHGKAHRQSLDSNKEALQGHLPRRKKVGSHDRFLRTIVPARSLCGSAYAARSRSRRRVGVWCASIAIIRHGTETSDGRRRKRKGASRQNR